MTLVVAKIKGSAISIVSDTRLSEHGRPLPLQQGVIKSCILPGDICVSFSNSLDLAKRDLRQYAIEYPTGADFAKTISYFENSSQNTKNEYIVAFANPPRLIKIADGRREPSQSSTQWIGDKAAYECFKEYEARARPLTERGRAVNAVLFADDSQGAPGSNLYSAMRHVIVDRKILSVGGFACVVTSIAGGFRHSVYADMLFDWPASERENFVLDLNDPIDFGASGENRGHTICQISTGHLNINVVAFYVLLARKIFLFHGHDNGIATTCVVINDVDPADIASRLNERFGMDLHWLIMVTSSQKSRLRTDYRTASHPNGKSGISFEIYTHVNTFPPSPNSNSDC